MCFNKNKAGLVGGIFLGAVHLIWALLIAITPSGMQKLIDWILGLHFIDMDITIMPFKFLNALILVIITFVVGYAAGFALAWLCNLVKKKDAD